MGWRSSRGTTAAAEIDLAAREDDGRLWRCATGARGAFGGAGASVDARKQARILLAARHYLAGRGDVACRCDVVALDALDPARIEWLRDAFGE
jgi:putative endonuclease